MHRFFVYLLALILLSSCATEPADCHAMQRRTEWTRIATAPVFADDAFFAELFLSGRAPDLRNITWYTNTSGQYMVCEAGDRRGCGDVTVLIEANGEHPADRMEEITLCGRGSAA